MEERLLSLLESVLGKSKKTSGDNYAFWSPFVNHHKPKLEINIKLNSNADNPWHCWISDEKGKSIRSLFRKLKVSKEIWDEHNSIFSRKYRYRNDVTTEESKVVQLPKEYIPLWKPSTSVIRKHALSYLDRRGVTSLEIIKYQIGYCEEGPYKHKVIVPSYDENGMLNYFVGRSFYDSSFKHKNPNVSKDIIGFELHINWDMPIVLVEGAFDAIAIKRNAIPLFGKTISDTLKKRIVERGVKTIYICLDDDAKKQAIEVSDYFMANGVQVHLVK